MVDELKPCPACGGPALRNTRFQAGGVKCFQPSHLIQTYGASQDDADEAWNALPRASSPLAAGPGL